MLIFERPKIEMFWIDLEERKRGGIMRLVAFAVDLTSFCSLIEIDRSGSALTALWNS